MGSLKDSIIIPGSSPELFTRYTNALQTLAARTIAEPWNFHRIDQSLCPAMYASDNDAARVLSACQIQFRKNARYSPQTIAAAVGIEYSRIALLSQQDTELDLPTAFEYFFEIYGQYIESRIADSIPQWIAESKNSEQIRIDSDKMRTDSGIMSKSYGSDGKEGFEAQLMAAIDGKFQEYPVRPFLSSVRKLIPCYEPGDYIVVAALSGCGKTYYALNSILDTAERNIPCTYINLENTPESVQKRIWQMKYGQRFERNMSNRTDAEFKAMLHTWDEVKKMPFKSVNPGNDVHAVINAIRHDYYERGSQFAVIDYAQLIYSSTYKGNRTYELTQISGLTRALALELNIPIVALAQFKQDVMQRGDKRGGMYDIKDSATFAQDATYVKSLHRPEYFNLEFDENGQPYPPEYADVFIVKGRETGTALAKARFNPIKGFYSENEVMPHFNYSLPESVINNRNEDTPF